MENEKYNMGNMGGEDAGKSETPVRFQAETRKSPELGIEYTETERTLSQEEQERLGIKKVRIKTITSGPNDLYQNPDKYLDIYNYLTEGMFPSYKTWTHVLGGDGGWLDDRSERFTQEGRYEQELLPIETIVRESGMYNLAEAPFFRKDGPNLEYGDPQKDPEKIKGSMLVYPMCMGTGKSLWRDDHNAPFFLFNNKNHFFTEYVKEIQADPEMREMLLLSDWHLNTEVELEEDEKGINTIKLKNPEPKISHTELYLSKMIPFLEHLADNKPELKVKALRACARLADYSGNLAKASELYEKLVGIDDGNYPRRDVAVISYLMNDKEKAKRYLHEHLQLDSYADSLTDFESEWEDLLKEYARRRESIITRSDASSLQRHDVAPLNCLVNGVEAREGTSIKFPIVRHPRLKPLRWCHSSAAVMRDNNNRVQVMLFES